MDLSEQGGGGDKRGSGEQQRVAELEALVSRLRHDLRGVITPAALIGDQLRRHSEPTVQRAGYRIGETVRRVLEKLDATYEQVPALNSAPSGPVLGKRTGDPGLRSSGK